MPARLDATLQYIRNNVNVEDDECSGRSCSKEATRRVEFVILYSMTCRRNNVHSRQHNIGVPWRVCDRRIKPTAAFQTIKVIWDFTKARN